MITIVQTATNKYKINNKGRALQGATMWRNIVNEYGVGTEAKLTMLSGMVYVIEFNHNGWGCITGDRMDLR